MPERIDIRELTNPLTPIEHRQNILKGLISQIPYLGPIINEYLPNLRMDKLTTFVVQLSEELNALKGQIDEDYIKRDDVSFIVEKILKSALENYDESKLAALKNGLINSLIKKDIELERKDFYLNILNSLTPFHLRVLYLLYDTEKYLSENEITLSTNIMSSRLHYFREALPDMNESEIKLIVSDLISKGLIKDILITPLQSQKGVNAIRGFESDFGTEFMEFFKKQ